MATYSEQYGASYTVDKDGVVTAATIPAEVTDAATYTDAISAVRSQSAASSGAAARGSFTIEEIEDIAGTWSVSVTYAKTT